MTTVHKSVNRLTNFEHFWKEEWAKKKNTVWRLELKSKDNTNKGFYGCAHVCN